MGFFNVCHARGLTGDQGVIIPEANRLELVLDQKLIDAVAAGQFHIWTVETIFDALELMTNVKILPADDEGVFPDGSLHALVYDGLLRLDSSDDDEDEEEEEDGDEEEVEGKKTAV